ncbi:iron chelate uptake ABC transporter family permease subunit [Zhihengliuella sp.]|uniref:FecCD family ABC transporter permease n=1 Tax=Zhihengliuella sp. TaxID=1954483 RepID=UPI0028120055|nr:iron chelate uptake ABC transporter family permease subunit [Zhihengliuella sp.]
MTSIETTPTGTTPAVKAHDAAASDTATPDTAATSPAATSLPAPETAAQDAPRTRAAAAAVMVTAPAPGRTQRRPRTAVVPRLAGAAWLRRLAVPLLLGLACVLAAAWHIAVGGSEIPLRDVLATLAGQAPDGRTELAVTEFRAPRTLAAVVAGAGLGVAGALTQTVARNPLASPDVLGITQGASFGAVAVLVLAGTAGGLSGIAATLGLPIGAALAGVLTALAVFVLAWRSGLESNRLIIVGLGLSGLAAAMTTWMLTLGDVTNAAQALTWMTGTINGRDWAQVLPIIPLVGAGFLAALLSQRSLRVIALHQDTAVALGMRINVTRVWLLGVATLLAVAATVLAGPVAFVALASPQIAKLMTRSTLPPIVSSALVGALFILLADLAAARLFAVALPAGVATAVVGAPYLIYLVVRQQRQTT